MIPEPDYHFVLHLPAEIAQERVRNRAAQDASRTLDTHEAHLAHLERAEQIYLDLVTTFPDRFGLVKCMDGERSRSAEEVHEEIWEKVKWRIL